MLKAAAVDPEGGLDDNVGGHNDDDEEGLELDAVAQRRDGRLGSLGKDLHEALRDDLQADGAHDCGKDHDAERLHARLADWILVFVLILGCPPGNPQKQTDDQIENAIEHGCDNGKRAGQNAERELRS